MASLFEQFILNVVLYFQYFLALVIIFIVEVAAGIVGLMNYDDVFSVFPSSGNHLYSRGGSRNNWTDEL